MTSGLPAELMVFIEFKDWLEPITIQIRLSLHKGDWMTVTDLLNVEIR